MSLTPALVMRRAWELFRVRYHYRGKGLGTPFKSIGRRCFAWALKEAWRALKAEAALRSASLADREARAAALTDEAVRLAHGDAFSFRSIQRMDAIRIELAQVAPSGAAFVAFQL